MMILTDHYNSPLGGITLAADAGGLVGLWFDGQAHFGVAGTDRILDAPGRPANIQAALGEGQAALGKGPAVAILIETRRWLDLYFAGRAPGVTPPLALRSTPFQRAVREQLLRIPYGQTVTYGELARRLGSAPRAVGGAVGHNPISLIVPCHRVLGISGLGGYAAGPERKQRLLRLEQGTLLA